MNSRLRTLVLLAALLPVLGLPAAAAPVREYTGRFPEKPYLGDKGYLTHPTPRAAYAAMITRMDREIGRIAALLRELDLGGDRPD